jgi:hypothetical protein
MDKDDEIFNMRQLWRAEAVSDIDDDERPNNFKIVFAYNSGKMYPSN